MKRSFVSPARYVQGPDTLEELGTRTGELGERALVVTDGTVERVLGGRIDHSFSSADVDHRVGVFSGECTEAEVDRFAALARREAADVIVGMGGGKALDVAKAVRGRRDDRLVTVPTVASTDAATSGLSVLYTDDGNVAGGIVHDRRPDLVLVDTGVVAAAPTRWFVSGIGDALATHFEAVATEASDGWTFAGGHPSRAGLALAETCYEVLRSHAPAALKAVRADEVTDAVEETVEAIVLLSGLGFENGGLAAAHAVHDGIAAAAETEATHGEKVCFGLLTHLFLADRPDEEIRDVARFARDVGLPVTLAALGVPRSRLEAVARATCGDDTALDNLPGAPTPADVQTALLAADELGRSLS